jgi:4-hydroxy-3-methylbut-2-enyl diphosphate reductase
MLMAEFNVLLANPRGFCRGVEMAIDVVNVALDLCGTPLYVKHSIVHNNAVIQDFTAKGVIFVEDVEEIPEGSYAVFSAHGSPPSDFEKAKTRDIDVIDATCRLVGNVHNWAKRFANQGYSVIVIGHQNHPESRGIIGHVPNGQGHLIETLEEVEALEVANPGQVACVTQTTLSVDDTKEIRDALLTRFPDLKEPPNLNSTICYATDNRQAAVKELAKQSDLVLVIGSKESSNTNRLREVARRHGAASHRIDFASEIDLAWLDGVNTVGVTSGASAPDFLVEAVIQFLRDQGATSVETLNVIDEDIAVFSLPKRIHEIAEEQGKTLENAR